MSDVVIIGVNTLLVVPRDVKVSARTMVVESDLVWKSSQVSPCSPEEIRRVATEMRRNVGRTSYR